MVILLTANIICGFSQTISLPNYALKSHETLEISKVEITAQRTVIYLNVENRITGGNFCADKNIFIIYPDGTRNKLISSNGIPVCPDTYKFKTIGEKLDFILIFPPLKAGTEWIDFIEDCNDNCFSFYGIILNSDLNKKIDEAVSLAERGETDRAIGVYKSIIESAGSTEKGVIGSLYSDLITLLVKKGDASGASEWYKKMLSSNVPRLQLYVRNLNSRGIKF